MKTEELRSKNIRELNEELLSLRKEQFTLRMQKAVGQASRFHQFKLNKKNIARVKTIINQKMNEQHSNN